MSKKRLIFDYEIINEGIPTIELSEVVNIDLKHPYVIKVNSITEKSKQGYYTLAMHYNKNIMFSCEFKPGSLENAKKFVKELLEFLDDDNPECFMKEYDMRKIGK